MRTISIPIVLVLTGLATAADRPNVLFIAVDDLNDWVGCIGGHPQVKTPNMDRLAAAGVVFRNAHCQAPLCNPSRTSLLIGLRPSTSGVYALDPWFRTSPPLRDWVTLPQYFERHGYRTLTTGKVFHDAYPPREDRVDGKEFTVWGYPGSFGPAPAKKFVETPDPHKLVDWGVYPEKDEQQEDWKVADWAIGRLKAMPKDRPFFLCVGFRKPHVPCYASQKWFDLYPDKTLMLPSVPPGDGEGLPAFSRYQHWKLPEPTLAWLKGSNQWRPLVRSYLACVSFVDSQVGRVLDALKAAGLAENTVIVLWGDNGWHLGEKGFTGKTSLWDRSTHVPLIFAGPGVSAKGRCERPAELLDIYPTLIDLCGLPARGELEGHSLAPQLKDANASRPWPAITTHGPNNHGIRTERWRYICYADGSEELYDMKADPHECRNLAGEPQHADAKRELAKWLPKRNDPPVAGSKTRLVEIRDGRVYWEGKEIPTNQKSE